jgi:RNA polymerase primary sigma factor
VFPFFNSITTNLSGDQERTEDKRPGALNSSPHIQNRKTPGSGKHLLYHYLKQLIKFTAMSMRQLKIKKSITSRESESLDKYLQEIGKVELLDAEQEVQLAILIRNGDAIALDKLTKANLRFVVSVAKQYQNQGMSLADLINEGNLGLIKAAHRFDETRGFKFISYAVWWIRQGILQALAEQSRIVRLPLNKVDITNRVQKTYSRLEQEYEREPSPQEIAEVLNLDLEVVSATLSASVRYVSMDTPVSDDDESTLLDTMENPNAEKTERKVEHEESLKTEIDRSLTALTGRQKEVICYFFGIGVDHPMTLEDIGQKFNLTRERVRQIKESAMSKLRTTTRCRSLRCYL